MMTALKNDSSERIAREPWRRFYLKVFIVIASLYVGGSLFADRYRIGVTSQSDTCIPGYRFFLIDKQDLVPERGAIYAFRAIGITPLLEQGDERIHPLIPHFRDGKLLIKYMQGIPGDKVSVDEQQVTVNGNEINQGLALANTLKKNSTDFVRITQLNEGEFWFAGATFDSFDSRYWGLVTTDQIVGRAYPLL